MDSSLPSRMPREEGLWTDTRKPAPKAGSRLRNYSYIKNLIIAYL
jgi:hypothetical protein